MFQRSSADILLTAECRLIHGWCGTETQKDFNDVFWPSLVRCGNNTQKNLGLKSCCCLSGHGWSRSLSRQSPLQEMLRFMPLNVLKLVTDGERMMEKRQMPHNKPWNDFQFVWIMIWIWILHHYDFAFSIIRKGVKPTVYIEKNASPKKRTKIKIPGPRPTN